MVKTAILQYLIRNPGTGGSSFIAAEVGSKKHQCVGRRRGDGPAAPTPSTLGAEVKADPTIADKLGWTALSYGPSAEGEAEH